MSDALKEIKLERHAESEVLTSFKKVSENLKKRYPFYFKRDEYSRYFANRIRNKNIDELIFNPIDYNKNENYRHFDKSYFFLNLYKSLTVVKYIDSKNCLTSINSAVDVGSGSGAASIALDIICPNSKRDWVAIDSGVRQLGAYRLFRKALGLSPATAVQADITECFDYPNKFLIASYALYPTLHRLDFKNFIKSFGESGFLIVDFEHVIHRFAKNLGNNARYADLKVYNHIFVNHISGRISTNVPYTTLADVNHTKVRANFLYSPPIKS